RLRPPPRSPLFPYTTLFRSMRLLVANGVDSRLSNIDNTTPLMVAAGVGFFAEGENPFTADEAVEAVSLCLELDGDPTAVDAHGEDRKSTRLNSSHDQISYAV